MTTADLYLLKVEKLKKAWQDVIEKGIDGRGLPVLLVPKARVGVPYTPSRQELLDMIHRLSNGIPMAGFNFDIDSGHKSVLHNLKLVLLVYECAVDAAISQI